MELINLTQPSSEDILKNNYNVLISTLGYHERCSKLIEVIPVNADYHLQIVHADYKIKSPELNSHIIRLKHIETEPIIKKLDEIFYDSDFSGEVNILIDISCMTKFWYGAIIEYLALRENESKKINAIFGYTPKMPFEQPQTGKIRNIYPVFNQLSQPLREDRPTALLLGLGCEEKLVQRIVKKIKPDIVHYCIADQDFNFNFRDNVNLTHKDILERTDNRFIHKYPVTNFGKIDAIFASLILELRLNYNVVIAPFGPKTFILTLMLLSLRYPDIRLLEIETKGSQKDYSSTKFLDPVFYHVSFETEDDNNYY